MKYAVLYSYAYTKKGKTMAYKRLALIALITISAAAATDNANAQIFRRACQGGSCYRTTTSYTEPRVEYTPRPCESVSTVEPCAPIATTTEPVEPCAPVEVVEPCAPIETVEPCAPVATFNSVTICENGTCPIRTAVRNTATVATQVVKNTADTARMLLTVNRMRARYGLQALRGDTALDAGCAQTANYCATCGTLAHTGGNEILAQNAQGLEVALNQWLASPAHRSLLLSRSFTVAGVSVVRGKDGRVWCAMRFR